MTDFLHPAASFLLIINLKLFNRVCCDQEGVAIEIAEAVIGALKGELAATAVNAPMVPAEVSSRILLLVSFNVVKGLINIFYFLKVIDVFS